MGRYPLGSRSELSEDRLALVATVLSTRLASLCRFLARSDTGLRTSHHFTPSCHPSKTPVDGYSALLVVFCSPFRTPVCGVQRRDEGNRGGSTTSEAWGTSS